MARRRGCRRFGLLVTLCPHGGVLNDLPVSWLSYAVVASDDDVAAGAIGSLRVWAGEGAIGITGGASVRRTNDCIHGRVQDGSLGTDESRQACCYERGSELHVCVWCYQKASVVSLCLT